eukprot:494602_1
MEYSTWDLGKFGIYDIIMVQYISNPYKLECTRKGSMTEDHKKVVKNVLKCCIDDEKIEITATVIRDKLKENGKAIVMTAGRISTDFAYTMKAIVMTAGKILTYFSYCSGAETMEYSTWDLGKFGIYDIIMVQYISNPYKVECTRKGSMTEDHKKIVKNVLKGCIDDDEKTKMTASLIRDKLRENGMKTIVLTAGRISTDFSYISGAQTMKYSTWDLGKFGNL